jgi:hypothetical protein
MIRRLLIVIGCMLAALTLAGCGSMPWEDPEWQAKAEARPQARPTGRAPVEARSTAADRTRLASAKIDPRDDGGDLRRTIERQSRRIAELEARPGAAVESEARMVVELLAFAQRLATLPQDEQGREYDAARHENARESGLYSRIRVALALSVPGTPFHDDARAAGLLEPVIAQPARTPLRQLAAVLYGQVSERLREQKRLAQLKEQIDGLRAIDRSLMDRDPGRK